MLFATSEELVIDVVQNIASERLNVEFSSSFEDLEKNKKARLQYRYYFSKLTYRR